jgi:hypothetical protein
MADFESAATKLMADAEYLKLVESSAPYFVSASTRDEMWAWLPAEEELKKAA